MQKLKENTRGITLIALVITIIVLIILASVSIAMLTGENGILNKATTAKERTLEAEDEEKVKLAVLAARDNNGKFSKELLKEELKKYGLTGTDSEDGTTTITANGKTYTIDSEGNVTSKTATENDDNEGMNNITAQMVAEHPETYYGLKVTNYTSTNGQNDWRIFYSDGTHIFLITGDYIEASKVDIEKTKMTRISGAKYIIYWSNWPQMQKMNHNELFNIENAFDIDNSTYTNAKCISTLLNTENWTEFLDKKDGSGKASYAIGGPTVEMWMKSWNEKYPETNEKYKKQQLLCNKISSIGYLVGIGLSSEIANSVSISSINELDGYNYSTLYYPQKGGIHDGNHYLKQYWMASPVHDINGHDNVSILTAVNYGYIGFFQNMNSSGLRPVIALKPGVTLNLAEVD